MICTATPQYVVQNNYFTKYTDCFSFGKLSGGTFMKKHLSKRLLSLLLAVAMLFTSAPIVAYAADDDEEESLYAYATYEDGAYKAQYYDVNTGEIVDVDDPIYENSFSEGSSSLEVFGDKTQGVSIGSVSDRSAALRLTANEDAPGSYATFESNPFAGYNLSDTGATIMGWNYYTVDKANNLWTPFITFYGVPSSELLAKYGLEVESANNYDDYWYVSFTLGGYILISKGAIDEDNNYNNYVNYMIDSDEDIVGVPYYTTTTTASTNATWAHYAFTIEEDYIKFYLNGVEYTYETDPGSDYDTGLLEDFSYLLDFICDENVTCSIGYGLGYWGSGYDSYIDDIRFYNSALMQIEIRAIYGENDDSVYKYAEGHDPTIVYNETWTEGEFLYYMFGTGMTMYGSNDLANWYEISDTEGRTGYQNQDLFGDVYTTALGAEGHYGVEGEDADEYASYAMPLEYSAEEGYSNDGSSTHYGRGLMIWAPSVIYNETTKKWQMYCAASSWGSCVSMIFVAEADSIQGPYDTFYPVLYSGYHDNACTDNNVNVSAYMDSSTQHRTYLIDNGIWASIISGRYTYNDDDYPNCIDATPFYDEDGNLYMSYGSFSGGIWLVKLNEDGHTLDNSELKDSNGNDADIYYGIKIASTTEETATNTSGSGEGSFIYYDNGYYYLTVTYGNVHQQRYTMRVWRSENVNGPYTDITGDLSTDTSTDDFQSGMKLMGNYQITGSTSYYDNGHSSNLVVPDEAETNEAGKTFIAYHTRMYSGSRSERSLASTNYMNEARVHQVLYNEEGWQCILPYQYSGETFGDDGYTYTGNSLAGDWSMLIFDQSISGDLETGSSITLASDGTISGAYEGTYTLSAAASGGTYIKMYLTTATGTVTYSGVLITMTDETGVERTVFSAVGNLNGYKTLAWGVKANSLSPASKAEDSGLSMISDDGWENIIYTHGENNSEAYGSMTSSDYMFYGDEISDGTVPNENGSTENHDYQAYNSDSVADNDGYEQGERSTYIYINKSYEITGITATDQESGISVTELTSDKEGYRKYLLTGTINGAKNAYDEADSDELKFFNTTVQVAYTNGSADYTENIYVTCMPNPVSANATAAAQTVYWFSYYESVGMLRADGSTGTVTATSNYGNYAYLDSPVDVGGLCGYDIYTNASNAGSGYTIALMTGSVNDIATNVNVAGTYALSTSTSSSVSATNSGVTANYYIDLSKLPDDDSTVTMGGLTVDTETGEITMSFLATEVPALSSAPTGRTQTFTISSASGGFTDGTISSVDSTWGTGTSTVVNGVYGSFSGIINADTTMMYSTYSVTANYTQAVESETNGLRLMTATATFRRADDRAVSNSVIGLSVSVYDKSTLYDELADYLALDEAEYTTETWGEFEEALQVAVWYCNNYKLFASQYNGQDLESGMTAEDYMEELLDDIEVAYEHLFSYNEFQQFSNAYELAVSVYDIVLGESTVDSEAVEALEEAIKQYGPYLYLNITDGEDEEITADNFMNIADKSSGQEYIEHNYGNLGTTDDESIAKVNYYNAYRALIEALEDIVVYADYSALQYELYGDEDCIYSVTGTEVTDGVALTYTAASTADTADDFGDDVRLYSFLETDDDGNTLQQYTLSSWKTFAEAYQTAQERSVEQGDADSIEAYRETEYKYELETVEVYKMTIEEDGHVTKEPNGTVTYTTNTLTEAQITINQATYALQEAYGELVPIDYEDCYEVYNEAQSLNLKADLDAYKETPAYQLYSFLNYGYIIDGVATTNYTYDTLGYNTAVFIEDNGQVYANTRLYQTDPITQEILETLNDTDNRSTYTVTFNIYIDGADEPSCTGTENYYFGQNVSFDATEVLENNGYTVSDYAVSRWEIKSENSDMTIINETGYTVEREIQQDTVVNLYLTTIVDDATKVTVVDYFGTQLDVGYINSDSEFSYYVDEDSNTLTYTDVKVRTHTVEVNEALFYTFTAWQVKTLEDGSIQVKQRGSYELPTSSYNIDDESGTVNGVSSKENVQTNTLLTFVADDEENFFAWIMTEDNPSDEDATWYVASYDSTFETLAIDNNGLTYRAISLEKLGNYFDTSDVYDIENYQIPFSFGSASSTYYDSSGNLKFRLYCNFTVADYDSDDSNIQIVQYGLLYSNTQLSDDSFIKGADGVTTIAATAASSWNTYSMTTTVGENDIYVRSFVSYMYTYTDANGKTTTIPRVAYGPIVKCATDGTVTTESD